MVKKNLSKVQLEKKANELENKWKRALADYLNLEKRVEKEKRAFMFFRYSFSKDGILTWRWVSNDLIKKKIKSSKDLYAFIKKNKNNEKLYGKPLKFKNDIQKQ